MIEQKEIKQCEGVFEPLVSIIVITYNSLKYVLETLESVKAQTYKNIELIISDDYSTDDTIIVCETWIKENKDYFVRTKLITIEKNTGIPANCNRGVKEAKGEWFKLIAGDDILLPTCIVDNIQYVKKSKDTKLLFSNMNSFRGMFNGVMQELEKTQFLDFSFFKVTAKVQHHLLAVGGVLVPAPTAFLNTKTIVNLELFDEAIRFCEDYPMWFKATNNGYKLDFMNVVTVGYRVHSESVMQSSNVNYEYSMKQVFFKYRFKYLLRNNFFLALNLYFIVLTRPYPILSNLFRHISPLTYIRKVKNK